MAEDDEIDVLGDFSLDNFLSNNDSSIYESTALVSQNTELLNCEYTIHPQWLLDKPSADPDNWYDSNLPSGLVDKSQAENDTLGHVSTANSITDESGWTEMEKNLLERGIEIFGKSNGRLSQFIGSKSAAEIKYYLKNFYLENQGTYRQFNDGVVKEISNSNLVSDVLDDTQIPASIEVIAAVSTGKPTVQVNKRQKKSGGSSDTSEINVRGTLSGHAHLKANCINLKKLKTPKSKKYELHKNKRKQKNVKFKFKANLKNQTKQKEDDHNKRPGFSHIEITTGKGLAVPICEGEEIVKINTGDEESDLDIEIDIEDLNEDIKKSNNSLQVERSGQHIEKVHPQQQEDTNCTKTIQKDLLNITKNETTEMFSLSSLSKSAIEKLITLEEPTSELVLDKNTITELEKVVHCEFFEGRPTKTPRRYLMIRNYIIDAWISQKPSYITKTSIRLGIKNCGDVNSIGRIHNFLEQLGVINFGCPQINYIRPLYNLVQTFFTAKEKVGRELQGNLRRINESSNRPRFKKKFNNDGEGGCTLTHDETGHVINTTIINAEPVKPRSYVKKPTVRLINCRSFSTEKPQPYTLRINLSSLLVMDFHAHTSLTEVMGLVAGNWIPQNKTLVISHYEPCINIASSATHCDMCPVSQAKAADIIHNKGLDILGWFHSHPTFAPEPSQQDIDTQQTVQRWIGHNKPCIGIILSPFSLKGALIASPYRCMVVDNKLNYEDQMVPYKFNVDLISDDFCTEEFLEEIKKVLKADVGATESKIEFDKPYFQDSTINYLKKYISSVRSHLAKCGMLSKLTCDSIIRGILNICNSNRTN